MNQRPRRIILASASVGAGHNQAARAVIAGLQAARPGLDVEFVDALKFVPRWFFAYYTGLYEFGVTRAPRAYGWSYNYLNKPTGPGRTLAERFRLSQEYWALKRYRAWLLDQRPALVVATHYLPMCGVGRMIGQGADGLGLFGVVTDNEAHRFWYAPNVERYFVPCQTVKDQTGRWQLDPARVTVSGIPVHPKWTAQLDRPRIYRDWNLPADKPIVLVSGGTFFTVGPVGEIVRGILDHSDAYVVVMCGNNKGLQASLSGFPEAGKRLAAVPFTDKGHELAEVASLFVTKPGGLTTAECLAKGLPMVLTKPVPGQEAANARLFSSEGAAVVTDTVDSVISQVTDLLKNPAKLAAMRQSARRLHLPATDTITRAIAEYLEA